MDDQTMCPHGLPVADKTRRGEPRCAICRRTARAAGLFRRQVRAVAPAPTPLFHISVNPPTPTPTRPRPVPSPADLPDNVVPFKRKKTRP